MKIARLDRSYLNAEGMARNRTWIVTNTEIELGRGHYSWIITDSFIVCVAYWLFGLKYRFNASKRA